MKSARIFDFQKKNVIRRTEILNDGYFFGLWDCVKITDVTLRNHADHLWTDQGAEEHVTLSR